MILIVHGWDGSGPGHWQHWLAGELATRGVAHRFPSLPSPAEPDRDAWVASLADILDQVQEPAVVVAHSLGCWAVDHLVAARGTGGLAAALLVAPPSPFSLFEPIQSFLPPPRRAEAWARLAERTLLVGSDNDDHAGPDELEEIANALRVPLHLIPGAGHINAAAGYGAWPFALDWLVARDALRVPGGG